MRLDKYLKISRIIKRRPLAKQIAEQNRIQVNGQSAKPALKVGVGDEIKITFGQTILTVKVLRIANHVRKDEAITLYEVINEERINSDE